MAEARGYDDLIMDHIKNARNYRALPDAQREALARQIPLGRLGAPLDIAEAVCFLAGPGAAWITGETLNVNGGMHMA